MRCCCMRGVADHDDAPVMPWRRHYRRKNRSAGDLLRALYFFASASERAAKLGQQTAQNERQLGVTPVRALWHVLHTVYVHLIIRDRVKPGLVGGPEIRVPTRDISRSADRGAPDHLPRIVGLMLPTESNRSEERRVGKECRRRGGA